MNELTSRRQLQFPAVLKNIRQTRLYGRLLTITRCTIGGHIRNRLCSGVFVNNIPRAQTNNHVATVVLWFPIEIVVHFKRALNTFTYPRTVAALIQKR